MVAGWVSAFRNRAYLGWLGLSFLCLSGYLLAIDRARVAHDLGLSHPGAAIAARVFLATWVLSFVLSLFTAGRETSRRIREIRASYKAREEALLEMIQAAREREGKERAGGGDGDPRPGSDDA
jgi:DNA-binding transcriptional MocR family regulator